jgi:hypothetical protein
MTAGSPVLEFWSEFDGRKVTLDGIKRVIRVRSYRARYPYERIVVNVDAVPTKAAMRSEAYRAVRRDLGDDWFTDILQSDPSVQEEILRQLS